MDKVVLPVRKMWARTSVLIAMVALCFATAADCASGEEDQQLLDGRDQKVVLFTRADLSEPRTAIERRAGLPNVPRTDAAVLYGGCLTIIEDSESFHHVGAGVLAIGVIDLAALREIWASVERVSPPDIVNVAISPMFLVNEKAVWPMALLGNPEAFEGYTGESVFVERAQADSASFFTTYGAQLLQFGSLDYSSDDQLVVEASRLDESALIELRKRSAGLIIVRTDLRVECLLPNN